MEELKVRVWDKKISKFEYYDLINDLDLGYFGDCIAGKYHKDRYEIDLFTGLKDKKRTKKYPEGQEIYEGDIVNFPMDTNFKVEFAKDFSGFVATNKSLRMGIGQNAYRFEVIGNIYNNSELLKENK